MYIVNSIILFSTFCTTTTTTQKKEDLVCSVGCGKVVTPSSPQDSHQVKSLLVSLRGSQSSTNKQKNLSQTHKSVRAAVFYLPFYLHFPPAGVSER